MRIGADVGNRANFVIVKDQDWQLFYSHWAGCRMLDSLTAGPEFALRYVQSLRPRAKNEWVSPMWADGGAVVDLDRRRLLFFGDELMVGMAERRAMMNVLTDMWPGYAIGWAYDGTAELAGYVGAEVRPETWTKSFELQLVPDRNAMCHLVSTVDGAGRVRMWPLWWGTSVAWQGPAVMDRLPGRGVRRLTLGMIPEGGLHIDLARKEMGAWQTADTMGIFQAIPELWRGWRTQCWEDRFEQQVARCDGALRLPELDLAAGAASAQAWIRDRVFQSFADSPAAQISKIAGLLAPIRPGLVVSDLAFDDCGVRPREDEWARFAAACGELRAARAASA